MDEIFDEEQLMEVASQLRRPHGEHGIEVGNMMNIGNERINLDMIDALDVQPQEHILEVGMGNGHFARLIVGAAEGVTYVGCDCSDVMVEEAISRNKWLLQEGTVQFHYAWCEEMPYKEGEFDKLCTANTIYFLDDPVAAIREFRRVLKPGGKVFLCFRPERSMRNFPVTRYNFSFWNTTSISELLEENGLHVIEILENEEPPQQIMGGTRTLENFIAVAERPA